MAENEEKASASAEEEKPQKPEVRKPKAEKKSKLMAKPGMIVELVKGEQWVDEDSGISLYRGFYTMVGQKEMEDNETAQESGYVKHEEKKPTAKIPDLPEDRLEKVEKALRLGILKKFDKDNPTVYVEHRERIKQTVTPDDNTSLGYKYEDDETKDIVEMLQLPLDRFEKEIKKIKSNKYLELIYDSEYAGRNDEARPRKAYVALIKKQMEEKGEGVGNIKTTKEKERVILR